MSVNENQFSEVSVKCEQNATLINGKREHKSINICRENLANRPDVELLLSKQGDT